MPKEQVRRKEQEDDEEIFDLQEEEKLRQKTILNRGEDISLPPLGPNDKQDVDW